MMIEKGRKMASKKTQKAIAKATIYNTSTQSKSQMRAESADAIALFLRKGGVIEQCKPSRRGRKGSKMASKSSRGFVSGTSGFATGYPKRSVGGM
jgi:hypothetical protein